MLLKHTLSLDRVHLCFIATHLLLISNLSQKVITTNKLIYLLIILSNNIIITNKLIHLLTYPKRLVINKTASYLEIMGDPNNYNAPIWYWWTKVKRVIWKTSKWSWKGGGTPQVNYSSCLCFYLLIWGHYTHEHFTLVSHLCHYCLVACPLAYRTLLLYKDGQLNLVKFPYCVLKTFYFLPWRKKFVNDTWNNEGLINI